MTGYDRERRVREVHEVDSEIEVTRPVQPVAANEHAVERETVERETYDPLLQRRLVYSKISNIVWTFIGLILALIGLRVVLRLIGANEQNGFVDFIYNLSWIFVAPFQGIVGDPQSDGMILEVNSLIAMLVYLIVAWVILRLATLLFDLSRPV